MKLKIYRIIGITHEDDSFNADELLIHRKKHDDIEVLKNFIDETDAALLKKISRMEGMIKIKFDPKDKRIDKLEAIKR